MFPLSLGSKLPSPVMQVTLPAFAFAFDRFACVLALPSPSLLQGSAQQAQVRAKSRTASAQRSTPQRSTAQHNTQSQRKRALALQTAEENGSVQRRASNAHAERA
jgi:hypothetical protein